jgi:hypothetical protein
VRSRIASRCADVGIRDARNVRGLDSKTGYQWLAIACVAKNRRSAVDQ